MKQLALWTGLVAFLVLCGLVPAVPAGVGYVAALATAGTVALATQPAVLAAGLAVAGARHYRKGNAR